MSIVGLDIFGATIGDAGTGGAPSLPLEVGPARVKNDRVQVFASSSVDADEVSLLSKGESVTIVRVLTSTGKTKQPVAEVRYGDGRVGYIRMRNLEVASAPSFVITDKPSAVATASDERPAPGWSQPQPDKMGPAITPTTSLSGFRWNEEDYAVVGIPSLLGALLGGIFFKSNRALGAFIGTGLGGGAGIVTQYARGRMGGSK